MLIVTGSDEGFAPLLKGLVESLLQWGPLPGISLGVLDLGLSADSLEWLRARGTTVAVPGWDLALSPELARGKPHLRAITARPWLPRYFPGHDIYAWIDADAWVQQRFALDWLAEAAAAGKLAIAPQVDRCYVHRPGRIRWRLRNLREYFGEMTFDRLLTETYMNSGIFALHRDAPHWDAWKESFRRGLERCSGTICCDQTALNYAVWTGDLPLEPLPALCNWLCHLALPEYRLSDGLFHEPGLPGKPIGILHLADKRKDMAVEAVRADGSTVKVGLRFGEARPRS